MGRGLKFHEESDKSLKQESRCGGFNFINGGGALRTLMCSVVLRTQYYLFWVLLRML